MSTLNMCRNYLGQYLPVDIFLMEACYKCFHFIYQNEDQPPLTDLRNSSHLREACTRTQASSTHSCIQRVTKCCKDAQICCTQQNSLPRTPPGYCPMTWDGYSCVNFTEAGQKADILCPSFVPNFASYPHARKQCMENAQWEVMTVDGYSWEPSDYVGCISNHKDQEVTLMHIKMVCFCISLVFLLVSIFIFCYFRVLRKQPRIRVHLNLFLALALHASGAIAALHHYEMVAYASMQENGANQTSLLMEGGNWCKLLSMGNRVFQSTTFLWMFCEALFLHRLLANTFEQKPSIILYLIIGWGIPVLFNVIYITLRAALSTYESFNEKCWVEEPDLEWMLRVPNLACIVTNIGFLINILRQLTNLSPQHNEPSTFRRSVRALLILVPIFGLQWIIVLIQLTPQSPHYFAYTVVLNIVTGSQGFLVSVIFCLLNNEVLTLLQKWCRQNCGILLNKDRSTTTRGTSGTMQTSFRSKGYHEGTGSFASSSVLANRESVPLCRLGEKPDDVDNEQNEENETDLV